MSCLISEQPVPNLIPIRHFRPSGIALVHSRLMIIVNFSHPLTEQQLADVRRKIGVEDLTVRDIKVNFDPDVPFAEQARVLVDGAELTPGAWQSELLLVNLPSLNYITGLLLAELHGRLGYFPSVLRLRRVRGSSSPKFEVAEILDLQGTRDAARAQR